MFTDYLENVTITILPKNLRREVPIGDVKKHLQEEGIEIR
jgi:hypothetical protein